MADYLDKLSSYDILNNIVPGAAYVFLTKTFGVVAIDTSSIISDLIVFYFIGMVISRFGSIFVEPILLLTRVITHSDYREFIIASAADPKIQTLVESNNQYRSYISLSILIILSYLASVAISAYDIQKSTIALIASLLLLALFALSYRKQTAYIRKRIDSKK